MSETSRYRSWVMGTVALAALGLFQLSSQTDVAVAQQVGNVRQVSDIRMAAADFEQATRTAQMPASTELTHSLDAKPQRRFTMSHVDRVRLRVWGNADLNGEYSVEADQTISLPGIGRIEVADRTPAELEKKLSEDYSSFARRDLTVSIEVTQYRPYYIVGQIAQPGSIQWRPGLKVIQAISLAGGIVRPTAVSTAADPEAREQRQLQLKYTLAQLARLRAEKDDKATVETSQQIAGLLLNMPSRQDALANFMKEQNAALDEQRQIVATQLEGLEREREGATRELEAAQVQEKAVGRQLQISEDQLENIEKLRNQNLVAKPRLLQQRSDLIAAQVRQAEAGSIVERARARIDTISRQMVELRQSRRAIVNERIENLERDVAQLEASLARSGRSNAGSNSLNYHITREVDGEPMTTVSAAVDTEVMPGDVVTVSSSDEEITLSSANGPREQKRADTQRVLEASATISTGGMGARQGGRATGFGQQNGFGQQ